MAQYGTGYVEAELFPEPGRRVVAELVRVPIRDRQIPGFLGRVLGPRDAVGNRVIQGPGIVSVSRFPLRPSFAPAPLRGLDLAFPALSPLGQSMLHDLPGERTGR